MRAGNIEELHFLLQFFKTDTEPDYDIINTLVNMQNQNDGDTALHLAAKVDNIELAYLLLDLGAEPLITNELDQTPYDIANMEDNSVVYLLEEYSRDIKKINQKLLLENPYKLSKVITSYRNHEIKKNESTALSDSDNTKIPSPITEYLNNNGRQIIRIDQNNPDYIYSRPVFNILHCAGTILACYVALVISATFFLKTYHISFWY